MTETPSSATNHLVSTSAATPTSTPATTTTHISATINLAFHSIQKSAFSWSQITCFFKYLPFGYAWKNYVADALIVEQLVNKVVDESNVIAGYEVCE